MLAPAATEDWLVAALTARPRSELVARGILRPMEPIILSVFVGCLFLGKRKRDRDSGGKERFGGFGQSIGGEGRWSVGWVGGGP